LVGVVVPESLSEIILARINMTREARGCSVNLEKQYREFCQLRQKVQVQERRQRIAFASPESSATKTDR